MTSGTALLHHEAPPALPSPLQYPHHLLALLALLAADIALTVWFTSLGLAELNPFIAPIAGSFAAQVVYKCPFALLLIAGTALLATSCDRLLPGARRRAVAVGSCGRAVCGAGGVESHPSRPLWAWPASWLIIALSVVAAFGYGHLADVRKIRHNWLMGRRWLG